MIYDITIVLLLIGAGIVCIFLAIIKQIKIHKVGKIILSTTARFGLGIFGFVLFVLGLFLQYQISAPQVQDPPRPPIPPPPIAIPLDVGWRAQGPGSVGVEYGDGILELRTNLRGGNDFAELFLELRGVRLPAEIERNPSGTYNLAGTELVATVSSDQNFMGDSSHPNGAQFLLKNEVWDNLTGNWINIGESVMSQEGMEIFFSVPDNNISGEVAGISLKFTIGSQSNATYDGSFFVHEIRIERR